jgi:CDP-glucose 4,6-dehydratase
MNFWAGKRAFVTGATGLVGSALVHRLLSLGAEVTILLKDLPQKSPLLLSGNLQKVSIVYGDLADKRAMKNAINESECSVIFHLGAQTIVGRALVDPISTFESNIQGTWNLLEAIRSLPNLVQSVVVASSDKAYGTSKVLPYLEDFPLKGEGPYDVSKSCTDLIAQSYGFTYRLPVVVARCGNIYGPGDLNWSRIIPGTIKSLFDNQIPQLRSDGKSTRDYIFVEDVVDAYLLLAEKNNGGVVVPGTAYNFSNDEALTVREVYNAICKELVGKIVEPVVKNNTLSEIPHQHLSSLKAKKDLDWKAQYDIANGLARTIPWYKLILESGGKQ